MSKRPKPLLAIEWTPNWVKARNTLTGQNGEGATLSDLGSVTSGVSEAIVGVGRGVVFLKTVPLPKAASDDLRRILSVQIGSIFPLPPDQVSFDFIQSTVATPEGYPTLVAAIRSDDLKRIRVELKQVGLTAERILPIALASPTVAAHAVGNRTSAGALAPADALVAESVDAGLALDVVQNGVVRFSRIAPSTSNPETEALRTLAAAKTPGLPIVAVRGTTFPGATVAEDSALTFLEQAPPFDFELTEDRIVAARKRVAERTRLALLLMASALLLVALVWADRSDAEAKVKKGQGAWARQLTLAKSIEDTETAKAAEFSGVQTMLKKAFNPAQPLSDITAVVSDSLPNGAWLTELTVERGKQLEVRGDAKNPDQVTTFVDALGNSPRVRDVRLIFANSATVGQTPIVQFNVTAICVGNLSLPQPETRVGSRMIASTSTGGTQ